jgi:hypothetical protein
MSKYSTAAVPVNLEHVPTLEEFRRAQARLAALVDRLYAAIAEQEARHPVEGDPLEPLRKAAIAAAPRVSLMPKYEPRERECDTCGETALCDYADPFDVDNPDVICGACEATERARPYAPLAEEEVA